MKIIKAQKIFDGERFIKENTLVIENNTIKDIFYVSDEQEKHIENIELYEGIICPGFINAHCHLELSYLKNQFTPHTGMVSFLKQMMQKRNLFDKDFIIEKVNEWDKTMQSNGIAVVGDIVNSVDTLEAKRKSKIKYINFVEFFGLNKDYTKSIFEKSIDVYNKFINNNLQAYLVPHSPYSLSESLWELFFNYSENGNDNTLSSFHFMESPSEWSFLFDKKNTALEKYFINDLNYKASDIKHIRQNFKERLKKYLNVFNKVILVHNTFLNLDAINYLNLNDYKNKIFFCLCPNANLFIENKLPDIEMINNFSGQICLGTDSLASNYTLNIIDEINTLLKYFELNIEKVLMWATSNGAKALHVNKEYGYIQKNFRTPVNIICIQGNKVILQKTIN